MKKALVLPVLALFVIGYSGAVFADTTDTSTRPQPPQFKNGTPPNFNFGSENGQKEQFEGRRPKYKPDSQPGGKMTPKEWDTSSYNGQPPQIKDGLKYGLKDGLKYGLKNGQANGDESSEQQIKSISE